MLQRSISEQSGQGYCQGGFSADFTTVWPQFSLPNPVIILLLSLILTHRRYLLGWQGGIGRTRQLFLARYLGHTDGPHVNHKALNLALNFSLFWVSTLGQVISAAIENIIKAYYPGYFMQSVEGQIDPD